MSGLKEKLKRSVQKITSYTALTTLLVGGAMKTTGCSSDEAEENNKAPKDTITHVERNNVKLVGKDNISYGAGGSQSAHQRVFYFDSDGDESTIEGIARKRSCPCDECVVHDFEKKVGSVKTENEWNKEFQKGHSKSNINWVKYRKDTQR